MGEGVKRRGICPFRIQGAGLFVKTMIILVVSVVLGVSYGLCLNLLGFKSFISLQKGIKKIPELTK